MIELAIKLLNLKAVLSHECRKHHFYGSKYEYAILKGMNR